MKNERTSKRVASIAGKVLFDLSALMQKRVPSTQYIKIVCAKGRFTIDCTLTELKALAASALTQAPDRKAK